MISIYKYLWSDTMEQKNSGISVFQRYLTVWVALSMVVGVLTEVPVMLLLCRTANRTKRWFDNEKA
jgi:ACR3 family arsenite efflux pump ArsB